MLLFFISGCDCTPFLEASPEVLNEMPTPIGPFGAGDRAIASFRGNGWPCSHVPYPFTHGVRRVALVRYYPQGSGGKAVEHGWCQRQFMSLSRGQRKTEGFSMSISDHADFCAIAAARAAKCFTMVSLFERAPFLGLPPPYGEP